MDRLGERSITAGFAGWVAERPDATALKCGHSAVSYAELHERAGRIAGWLGAQGVGLEDIVAVQGRRSIATITALLGVLHAGAAYLALDPEIPPARIDNLLGRSKATILITEQRLDTLAGPAAEPVPVNADALAYVCFTSGSTGQPKGVCVPHRAVVRLADAGFVRPGEPVLHVAPLSFDASTFEIWTTLLSGGQVVLHPPGRLALDDLADTLSEVSTAFLTAGLFSRMVDDHMAALGGLRQIIAGGDVVSPAHVDRLRAEYPNLRLLNGYGPTENTTFSSYHVVSGTIGAGTVPIGGPMPGTRLYVLDENLRPAQEGELYTGGEGVARGYLGMPGRTAASFVPDPFAGQPGARMYHTGDRVRRLPNGELEFLGRLDNQVKIRGFRVEPAEVEALLAGYPAVRQAVVTVSDEVRPGQQCLIGHVTAMPEVDPDDLVAGLRRLAHENLPEYMVPAVVQVLDEFPLTREGKVSRKALPVPKRVPRDVETEFVPPRTPDERLLCGLWSDALGMREVGVRDDFFSLGGNSLLAMDLVTRMETALRAPISPRMLMFHPTIEELAEAVRAGSE